MNKSTISVVTACVRLRRTSLCSVSGADSFKPRLWAKSLPHSLIQYSLYIRDSIVYSVVGSKLRCQTLMNHHHFDKRTLLFSFHCANLWGHYIECKFNTQDLDTQIKWWRINKINRLWIRAQPQSLFVSLSMVLKQSNSLSFRVFPWTQVSQL